MLCLSSFLPSSVTYAVAVGQVSVESNPDRNESDACSVFIRRVLRCERNKILASFTKAMMFVHPINPTTSPGRFGPYGCRYVPKTLIVALFEPRGALLTREVGSV